MSGISSTNRMEGLISGLKTEDLVKSMAASTKNKLNTKKQKLQSLSWKQEDYRALITKASDFKTKFLNIESTTSIRANAVMKKFAVDCSDSRLSATASSTAAEATYTIKNATSASAANISSTGAISNSGVELDFSKAEVDKEYKTTVNLDGIKKEIAFKGGADAAASKQNFLTELNNQFSTANGAAHKFKFLDNSTELVYADAADGATSTSDGIVHKFVVGFGDGIGLDNDVSNIIGSNSTLESIGFVKELQAGADGKYKITINKVDFEFDKNTTISSMINKINSSEANVRMTYSSFTQSFKLESKTSGIDSNLNISQSEGNLLNSLFNTDTISVNAGRNSTVTVSKDGGPDLKFTSATDTYTFDGTTINVAGLGNFNPTEAKDYIAVTTKKDNSAIKDTVKNFITAYNEVLGDLNKAMLTARPKSKGAYYEPLTEEQQEDMEKDEIEKWNENAKTGLLYHDSSVQKLVSNLRATMTTSINGMSLADLGITVSKEKKDYGKLIIDESKLENCIENYGDKAADLFTNLEEGIGVKLSTAIDKAVSTKKDDFGYLTNIAGVANTNSEKENLIFDQMDTIQKMITSLESKYEKEQERYWAKFTQLETYMNNMNAQASIFNNNNSSY